jgi:hypothetical protein
MASVGQMFMTEPVRDRLLASPPQDLAVVGTRKWLIEDIGASLAVDAPGASGDQIAQLVLPNDETAAAWWTEFISSVRQGESLTVRSEVNAVILDGNGAIKFLSEVDSLVAICIIDRSVADETGSEVLLQLRNSGSEAFSLRDELGWRPPPGVEALAFLVAL